MKYSSPGTFTGVLFLVLLLVMPVRAEQSSSYDRIHLSAAASQEVEADTVKAILYAQQEGEELGRLTDTVNRAIKQAVERSKQTPGVRVETRSYQTRPVYHKQHRSGWRVRQAMQLESENVSTLNRLLGELQDSLAIESITYSLSPDLRREVEQQLIIRSLEHFEQRAESVTRQLGRERYRLVELSINTAHSPGRPVPMRSLSVPAESRAGGAPHVEPGRQTLQVRVNGTIELVVD